MDNLADLKYEILAEQSLLGMIIIKGHKVLHANEKSSEILGYPIEEIRQWSLKDILKITPPEDLHVLLDAIKEIQTSKKDSKSMECSHKIKTKNGNIKWVKSFTKNISYRNETLILTTIVDITEQIEAKERIIEFEEQKSDIITRISHELRTPLITVKGYNLLIMELLQKFKYLPPNEIKTYLRQIDNGCKRLEEIVNSISLLEDVSPEKIIPPKPTNLSPLIIEDIGSFLGSGVYRDQAIYIDVPPTLLAQCEDSKFHLVLYNLFTNAVKYTPPGGSIKIQAKKIGDKVRISVIDDGVGFTRPEIDRLFTKLGKIERSGKGLDIDGGGLGMGLYISKILVESCGGSIWVESGGKYRGSSFCFTVPAA